MTCTNKKAPEFKESEAFAMDFKRCKRLNGSGLITK